MERLVRRSDFLVLLALLGLGLEVLVFGYISRFRLFVGDTPVLDGAMLFGVSLAYVVLASQLLITVFPIPRVPAMSLLLLAAMWAWAAVLALGFFVVFLYFMAIFSLIYVPVSGLTAAGKALKIRR